MLKTELCRTLGIEYPIFSAGMGVNIAGPALTAAVSNAGGCGVLGAGGLPGEMTAVVIRDLRQRTSRTFGVNLLLPLLEDGQVEACLEARVPFIVFFWGEVAPYVADAHARGVKVFVQVGSVEEAADMAAAGVDAIIAQGNEAGGHVKSRTALSTIVPAVVKAVAPVPVIASGGIATGDGIAAALALGAQGVSLGTRFLCTTESQVAPAYKQRVVEARAEDTVYTRLHDVGWENAEHRVLRSRTYREWEAAGSLPSGRRPGEGTQVAVAHLGEVTVPLPKYTVFPPVEGFVGDIEDAALYAGESCRLVNDVKPAALVMEELVADAEHALGRLRA